MACLVAICLFGYRTAALSLSSTPIPVRCRLCPDRGGNMEKEPGKRKPGSESATCDGRWPLCVSGVSSPDLQDPSSSPLGLCSRLPCVLSGRKPFIWTQTLWYEMFDLWHLIGKLSTCSCSYPCVSRERGIFLELTLAPSMVTAYQDLLLRKVSHPLFAQKCCDFIGGADRVLWTHAYSACFPLPLCPPQELMSIGRRMQVPPRSQLLSSLPLRAPLQLVSLFWRLCIKKLKI